MPPPEVCRAQIEEALGLPLGSLRRDFCLVRELLAAPHDPIIRRDLMNRLVELRTGKRITRVDTGEGWRVVREVMAEMNGLGKGSNASDAAAVPGAGS